MDSLAVRAAKYYAVQGLKSVLYIFGLEALLVVEWIIIGMDSERPLDYVLNMVIAVGSIFIIMCNMMFSTYGPNWYDSMVLSLGARRIDVFRGELIKQIIFVLGNGILLIGIGVFIHDLILVQTVVMTMSIGLVAGAIGTIVGFKIRKFGKIVLVIIGGISGGIGAFAGLRASDGKSLIPSLDVSLPLVVVGAIIIFALLEIWVYKLNKESMVQ